MSKTTLVLGMLVLIGALTAAELNPAAITIKIPSQIPWVEAASGASAKAILYGDPSEPGWYILLNKWHPNHMSRPHMHPNDRYITVLSGTWYVGTGADYDPDSTKPMKAGSFVVHTGKQLHYDGAKDDEAVLQIVGMGPESMPATDAKK